MVNSANGLNFWFVESGQIWVKNFKDWGFVFWKFKDTGRRKKIWQEISLGPTRQKFEQQGAKRNFLPNFFFAPPCS
jgi:hypothetical protein